MYALDFSLGKPSNWIFRGKTSPPPQISFFFFVSFICKKKITARVRVCKLISWKNRWFVKIQRIQICDFKLFKKNNVFPLKKRVCICISRLHKWNIHRDHMVWCCCIPWMLCNSLFRSCVNFIDESNNDFDRHNQRIS